MTVLAVAEHRRGELRPVSLEAVTAGRQLADETGSELHVAVVSGDVERFADRLDRSGVDMIHTVADGEEFNHDVYTQALTQVAEAVDAAYLLAPNTVNGLDYVPALASRLGCPLVTDVTALAYEDGLTVNRDRYGSKVTTTIDVAGDGAAVTLRPGEWPTAEGTGDAVVEPFEAAIDADGVRSTVTGFEEVGGGEVDITDAEVLVAVGRGIGDEEHLKLIYDLADAMGGTIAASRPLIDSGWLEKERHVGQSGAVVTPEVYLAIGISGAVHHVAGMKGSDTVVAINDDPTAPIFDVADYGIVGDLFEVVPALTEALAD